MLDGCRAASTSTFFRDEPRFLSLNGASNTRNCLFEITLLGEIRVNRGLELIKDECPCFLDQLCPLRGKVIDQPIMAVDLIVCCPYSVRDGSSDLGDAFQRDNRTRLLLLPSDMLLVQLDALREPVNIRLQNIFGKVSVARGSDFLQPFENSDEYVS